MAVFGNKKATLVREEIVPIGKGLDELTCKRFGGKKIGDECLVIDAGVNENGDVILRGQVDRGTNRIPVKE